MIYMASKTISVREEVYNLLKKMKLPGESFGDTIFRLCRSKTSRALSLWAKTSEGWSDMSEEEIRIIEDTIHEVQTTLHEERVDLS